MEKSPLPPPPAASGPRGGKLLRLFSPAVLKNELAAVAARFPVTIVFLCLLTVFCLTFVWNVKWSDEAAIATGISLSLGSLMSLAVGIWCEYLRCGRRKWWLWQGFAVAFAAVNFIYIYNRGIHLDSVDGIGYSAAYTALVVAVFFLPAVRRSSLGLQWSYSVSVLNAVAMGLLLAFVLGCFCSLVFGTLHLLFGLNDYKVVGTMSTLLAGLVPAVAALCFMPHFSTLEDEDAGGAVAAHRGISVFTKNVLLPLAVVYMAILYVYGLKILFTFRLPNGYVCWMVIGLVSAVLLIVYGLQGYVCHPDGKESTRRIAALAIRWLPLLQLPLLVLMSVAIFYRINQYGVTPSRLYVASFNIWAYLVVAYLYFCRAPRLNVVATSFASIFLLTSVIPHFNYCTWGLNAVRSKVKAELREAGAAALPLDYEQLMELLNTLPRAKAESLASDLSWLDDWNNHTAVADIVDTDKTLYRWQLLDGYMDDAFDISRSIEHDVLTPVPEGYASVSYRRFYDYKDFAADTDGYYDLKLDSLCILRVPVDSLATITADDELRPVRVDVVGYPSDVFYITDFSLAGGSRRGDSYSHITVGGYLFRK